MDEDELDFGDFDFGEEGEGDVGGFGDAKMGEGYAARLRSGDSRAVLQGSQDLELSFGSSISGERSTGSKNLANLSVVDGGLEVDLGETMLHVNSASSIDVRVRERRSSTELLEGDERPSQTSKSRLQTIDSFLEGYKRESHSRLDFSKDHAAAEVDEDEDEDRILEERLMNLDKMLSGLEKAERENKHEEKEDEHGEQVSDAERHNREDDKEAEVEKEEEESIGNKGDHDYVVRSPPDNFGNSDVEESFHLSEFDKKMSEDDGWEKLNHMLAQAGFNPVDLSEEGVPDPCKLCGEVRGLLVQYEKRGDMIQELTMEASSSEKHDSDVRQQLERAQNDIARLRERLKTAENAATTAQEESHAFQKGDANQLRKFQKENKALQQQLALSEHRVKAKEAEMDRLQGRLRSMQLQLEKQKEKSRDVFREVLERKPRVNSQSDQKILEIVEKFETERQQMQEEQDLLNAEIRRLNEQLKERENELNGSKMSSLTELERELAQKKRDVEMDQQVGQKMLEERERNVILKLTKLEKQLRDAKVENEKTQDVIANLKLELKSRPTMRDWKEAQREIARLEEELQVAVDALEDQEIDEARRFGVYVPKRGKNDKETLSAREKVELLSKRALAENEDNKKFTSTSELIRRDKMNHRLGLSKITALPKSAAHNILQEVCRVLEVSDAHVIVPSLQKLCWIVRAMPRMEKFVKEVSSFVMLHGDDLSRESPGAPLEAVLPQLKRWMNDVRTASVWKHFREEILTQLSRAPSLALPEGFSAQSTDLTNEQIVQAIRNLVALERGMMDQQSSVRASEAYLKEHPETLVSRSVAHFQQLFGVRSVDGIFPKMNELYVFSSEMENFLRVLRPTLGLRPGASVHACLSKVQEVARGGSVGEDFPQADDDVQDVNLEDLNLPQWD